MLTCPRCSGLTPPEASTTCLHCEVPLPRPPRWARRLTGLLGPAGAILLAACYGAPGRYHAMRAPADPAAAGAVRLDRDHDGVPGAYDCTADRAHCAQLTTQPPPADLDCDDSDATRFPGGADVDGDGVDSNCDGVDGWADSAQVAAPPAAGAGSPPATIAVPPAP